MTLQTAQIALKIALFAGIWSVSGCAPVASALQARSARRIACHPAHELTVTGHQPGDPQQNIPERWTVSGCGGTFQCSSVLLTSGQPAHTDCTESKSPAQPRDAAVQQVAAASGCPAEKLQITGEVVQGTSRIHLVVGCGHSFRCRTEQVSRGGGHTRCDRMEGGETGLGGGGN